MSRTGSRRGFPQPPAAITYLLEYYRDPVALLSLVATSLLLTYGGGAVLFWFHAIYLGEAGPSLIPVMHWVVDSTLGFFALTPPLALLIPVALRKAERPRSGVVQPWRFAIIAGTAFAIITAPGPLVHDAAVGRGKWLAVHITLLLIQHLGSWVFRRPGPIPATEVPWLANVLLQVDVGWPTYVLLMRFSYRLHTTAGGAIDQRPQPQPQPQRASQPVMAGAGIGVPAPAMATAASASQPAGALAGGAAMIASLMGQSNGQHGSGGMNHDGLGGVPAYYDIPGTSAASAAPAYAPAPASPTPAAPPAYGPGNGNWNGNGNGNGTVNWNGNGSGNGTYRNGRNGDGMPHGNGHSNGAPRPSHGYQAPQAAYPAPPPSGFPAPSAPSPAPPPAEPPSLPMGPLRIPESVWQNRPDPPFSGSADPFSGAGDRDGGGWPSNPASSSADAGADTDADWPLDEVDTGQWLAARAAIERGSRDDLDLEQWLQQLEAGWQS